MIIPETQIHQAEAGVGESTTDDLPDIPDTYRFWGIVQQPGPVTPVNAEEIYYTSSAVVQSPNLAGSPVRIDHMNVEGVDSDIGEVIDEAVFEDIKFGLHEIYREQFEGMVEDIESENGNISLTFNQLVREIDDGNLALSAGLGVSASPTPIHERTVHSINAWNEVSVVGKPASPASWAWSCGDESCEIVFGEQMTGKQFNVDLEALQERAEEGDGPTQVAEVVQSDDWGDEIQALQLDAEGQVTLIDSEDEVLQGDCGCNTEALQEKLESVKQERDKYKEVLDKVEQKQREQAAERLRSVNDDLPEDAQYEEQELESLIEDSDMDHLQQTADMLERVHSLNSGSSGVEQGEEDLTGSGSGGSSDEEVEEMKENVNQVSNEMFGKDLDDVMDEIESGTWGN